VQLERVSRCLGCRAINLLMTPRILAATSSTVSTFVGFFDLMRTAVLETTVSMGFSPAALIVSPDSANVSD
jgi:hypothetical protein